MNTSESEFDVIVIGELNVDIILNEIESFPSIGKEILANQMTVTLGSSSAIFASNLSSLGAKVAFLGKVGDDNFAKVVIDSLQRKKVNTSNIIKSQECSTGATIVLNYGEDRAMVTYPGAMSSLTIRDIDFTVLQKAGHLHFSSYFLQPGIREDLARLFQRAKELGLTTSIDPQWDPQEKWDMKLKELLPWVDIFLPNMQELQHLTGTSSLKESIAKIGPFANMLIVKDGNNGAWAWDGKELIHRESFLNREVIDCIGAGDSFNAGFISKFVKKCVLSECLEFGALAGAISTTEAGGTKAFETMGKIKRIARERFNHNI